MATPPLQVGMAAPGFSAPALMPRPATPGTFETLSLSQLRGKYVVLFFYPLDFTFVCPTEIIAFSDRQVEFNAIGAQIVAVSCDSKFSHLAWTRSPRSAGGLGELNVPLLSDFDKEISRDYGVLTPDGVPLRASYILGPDGTVRQATLNDLPVGRSVDETIRLIKAFQHTDAHGDVCPANWQPGGQTMQPSPEGARPFFSGARGGGGAGEGEGKEEEQGGEVTRIQFGNLPLLPPATTTTAPPTSTATISPAGPLVAALAKYQALLKSHPLPTKAVTSCVIALVGELVGSYLKQRAALRKQPHQRPPALVNWRRLGVFGVYGLAITGPTFHWWYGALERLVVAAGLPPGSLRSVALKIALDRLLLTPPFLLFSLGFLQYFQTLSVSTTAASIRNTYAAALYTNWRVWSPAQAVNFALVPLEFRVLFGNLVALWWNVYLSMVN